METCIYSKYLYTPVSRNPTISVSADDGSSVWSDVASPPPTR